MFHGFERPKIEGKRKTLIPQLTRIGAPAKSCTPNFVALTLHKKRRVSDGGQKWEKNSSATVDQC